MKNIYKITSILSVMFVSVCFLSTCIEWQKYAPVECADGNCYDINTKLTWANQSIGTMSQIEAVKYCEELIVYFDGDWRLPDINELRTLVRGCSQTEFDGSCNINVVDCLDESCGNGSCVGCGIKDDTCYEPEDMQGTCGKLWSSSINYSNTNYVWGVDFSTANVQSISKNDNLFVRCIKGDSVADQGATDGDSDLMEGDNLTETTWYDNVSGLLWQNPPKDDKMNWLDGVNYCNELNLDSHGDWHMPTISELRSIIRGCEETEIGGSCEINGSCSDLGCEVSCNTNCQVEYGPANGCYWFNDLDGSCKYYWSTPLLESIGIDYAWSVSFMTGDILEILADNLNYVRCVRSK